METASRTAGRCVRHAPRDTHPGFAPGVATSRVPPRCHHASRPHTATRAAQAWRHSRPVHGACKVTLWRRNRLQVDIGPRICLFGLTAARLPGAPTHHARARGRSVPRTAGPASSAPRGCGRQGNTTDSEPGAGTPSKGPRSRRAHLQYHHDLASRMQRRPERPGRVRTVTPTVVLRSSGAARSRTGLPPFGREATLSSGRDQS